LFRFLGFEYWRELNDWGMNFIPTSVRETAVKLGFAAWHVAGTLIFWSGFARRGTVVPGNECVKNRPKIANFLLFSRRLPGLFLGRVKAP
jgi:hypothetical protein